jgi:hypothetical protein
MKSRRMRWTGHVARAGEARNAYKILVGKFEGKRPLGRSRLGGKIILQWVLGKIGEKVLTGFIWLRIGTSCRLL